MPVHGLLFLSRKCPHRLSCSKGAVLKVYWTVSLTQLFIFIVLDVVGLNQFLVSYFSRTIVFSPFEIFLFPSFLNRIRHSSSSKHWLFISILFNPDSNLTQTTSSLSSAFSYSSV